MKKNRMMRLASVLLVCVLLTTSVISGTFAKYVSTVGDNDKARVAYWGFGLDSEISIKDLFEKSYDESVVSKNNDDVIAPGTYNFKTFKFAYTTNATESAAAPEVDYNFTVSVKGSKIADSIKNNSNIEWALVRVDGTAAIPDENSDEWGSWEQLMTDILKLSGDTNASYSAADQTSQSVTKKYEANNAPADFADGTEWIVAWQWKFTTEGDNDENGIADQDETDTAMGNKSTLDEVEIYINITAEQIN